MTPTRAGRFAGITRAEVWGYIMWGSMALVIAIPEITAAVHHGVPWPTISGMTGHLENRWSAVALIVVALIVVAAIHAVRFPASQHGPVVTLANQQKLGRTQSGRFTLAPDKVSNDERDDLSVAWLVFALAVVVVCSVVAAHMHNKSQFFVGYVLYGLIAVFFLIIPSALAYWFATDVAFPSIFRTLTLFQRRLPIAATILLIGFVILLIHLALYPWPNVFHQLQRTTPHSL
jgi:hypothetical protein